MHFNANNCNLQALKCGSITCGTEWCCPSVAAEQSRHRGLDFLPSIASYLPFVASCQLMYWCFSCPLELFVYMCTYYDDFIISP
jgi:hypothetical protein